MKLVSSSPKTKHTHRVHSDKSWFWPSVRSRVLTPRFITSLAWLLMVVVVAVFTFAMFHLFSPMVATMAGSQ